MTYEYVRASHNANYLARVLEVPPEAPVPGHAAFRAPCSPPHLHVRWWCVAARPRRSSPGAKDAIQISSGSQKSACVSWTRTIASCARTSPSSARPASTKTHAKQWKRSCRPLRRAWVLHRKGLRPRLPALHAHLYAGSSRRRLARVTKPFASMPRRKPLLLLLLQARRHAQQSSSSSSQRAFQGAGSIALVNGGQRVFGWLVNPLWGNGLQARLSRVGPL
jgi:hypothetical protein